jgi:hypothetical protein
MPICNLPLCPRCELVLIPASDPARRQTMICPACHWDVAGANKAGPELLRAVELFLKQYAGNGNDERERRPEIKAARLAIKKALEAGE